jgi:membrane protease YdiL (CAAX protease family)
MPKNFLASRNMVVVAVLFEGGLGLLGIVLARIWGIALWQETDSKLYGFLLGVAATIPLLLIFGICLLWPIGPLQHIRQFAEEVVRPAFAGSTIFDLALVSLAAGFGEEILFRGVTQQGLSARWGPWPALAVASVLFGLMHPISPAYVLLATAMGAYLGSIWMASGDLMTVIIAHGLYDFLALAYITRPLSKSQAGSQPAQGNGSIPTSNHKTDHAI